MLLIPQTPQFYSPVPIVDIAPLAKGQRNSTIELMVTAATRTFWTPYA